MRDYSQWGEQAIIAGYLQRNNITQGRFLDIGAFDGVTGSNTRFLAEQGWSGLCVEAAPRSFIKLADNCIGFPSVNALNGALNTSCDILRFRDAGDQLGTCDPNSKCHIASEYYYVAGITPDLIASRFGTRWDVVSLDIEGMDEVVLPLMGCLLEHTSLLVIEDARPFCEFDPEFQARMYALAAGFGLTQLEGTTTIPCRSANSILSRP